MAASRSPVRSDDSPPADNPSPRPSAVTVASDVGRGALIGVAETIPGVSGGTVALITGIYDRLIATAKAATTFPARRLRGVRSDDANRVDWWLMVPVLAGMAIAVFSIAGVMEGFVTEQPVYSQALFIGMIAVSVAIPFQEIPRGTFTTTSSKLPAVLTFVMMAVLVFVLTSLPRSEVSDPPLVAVFFAASVAVCALVLPGVSGSFFLLVIGLYAPTLAAVDDRDLMYLGVFAAGAVVGLASFVQALEWLLRTHHSLAMVGAAGLLLGSLRALWPWQDPADGAPMPIGDDWPGALGMFVLGAAIVGAVALVQRRLGSSNGRPAGAAG
ncbi:MULTISPECIES: DUF368 domain-containing protein [Gordonia]|uniref:DUF368 domain-containing protein n=1 Tax=Gordonia TaxID=2053 RepID=UPI00054FEB6B|nr:MULTISPECIES: DUF368 domain-containing protein [Gordonia]MDH3012375.1 DUF368 domain-containing protein [Gordonia alkanivorans]QGP89593.1 DUF368 domain-containing protein [Gordonia sp. 135]